MEQNLDKTIRATSAKKLQQSGNAAAFKHVAFAGGVALLALATLSCAGGGSGVVPTQDLCNCQPFEPLSADFRHNAKHVPIPNIAAQEIGVDTILSWTQHTSVAPDAPRTGRELQVFHVQQAFLQNASVNGGDCDIHMEISSTADRNAPRVVVETPIETEFCSARKNIQSQLAQHGFQLDLQHGGDLPRALPAEILGMAFEDFGHKRGSPQVATLWELHPAVVTLLP